uniref:SCP domain-containing protein n=2 Tax=Octopus bimaculoides TaxID=37653 RepID=A0A0L8H9P6_OCTBM
MVLATIYFILLLMSHSGLSEAYCSEQFRIRGGHTACLEKSPKLKESLIVTDVQKSIIIALHNVIRVKVQPPSCNMFRMHWDYELAYLAQKWSDNCVLKNDEILNRSIPLKYNVGQNIAAKFSKWYDVIRYWRSEGKDFKYGRKHSKNTAQYTQLVWATSILIGCGASLCSNIGTFYVCNYAPAGNINGEEPYRRCNKTRSLRDCGHNACYNFGILNVEDCSCSCYEHSHTYGHNCLLNCSFSDISIKCKKIPVDYCHYAHLRPSCPWLCKECSIASWSQRTNWFLLFVVQIFIPGLTMCSN